MNTATKIGLFAKAAVASGAFDNDEEAQFYAEDAVAMNMNIQAFLRLVCDIYTPDEELAAFDEAEMMAKEDAVITRSSEDAEDAAFCDRFNEIF
jgi:hypothetical protein